ncbi:hypothetical protein F5146DRAFT_997975 [Armillaria mellea]|nr:hypothetical protein F5146DRAFT_997975 [Armillaria mellea]
MANAAEFFLGAEPLLFKIRGGPVPPYYQETNKHLQDLADVYANGPRADPHIDAAWRIYYHIVRLRDMLDNETFRTHMRQLHSAPYEMLGVRGSVLLWRKLKEDAKRWDNADGPGSLKKIGDDARRQEREDRDLVKMSSMSLGTKMKIRRMSIRGEERIASAAVIPMDPIENGSKDKGPSRITRSKRASGKRLGADVHGHDEAHPKKKLRDLSYHDMRRLTLPEREKYLMSTLNKTKARTRVGVRKLLGPGDKLFYAQGHKRASEPGLYPVPGKARRLFSQESSITAQSQAQTPEYEGEEQTGDNLSAACQMLKYLVVS